MIVRLGEAAALAGEAPWPPGEKLKVNPFGTQKGAFAVKEKRPRYQRKERKEKVAVAVEPPVKKPHPSKGVPLKRVLTPKPPRKKPVTDADGWESGGL